MFPLAKQARRYSLQMRPLPGHGLPTHTHCTPFPTVEIFSILKSRHGDPRRDISQVTYVLPSVAVPKKARTTSNSLSRARAERSPVLRKRRGSRRGGALFRAVQPSVFSAQPLCQKFSNSFSWEARLQGNSQEPLWLPAPNPWVREERSKS